MLRRFVLGLVLGGVTVSTGLWLLSGLASPVPRGIRDVVVLGVAGLAVLRDLGVVRLALPQNARQVPQDVLARSWHRGALRFGFELGTGVRTFVSASAPYALAVALLLVEPALLTAALPAGVGFGTGRALAPLLRRASGDGAAWDGCVVGRHRLLKIGTSVAVAVVLAVALLRW